MDSVVRDINSNFSIAKYETDFIIKLYSNPLVSINGLVSILKLALVHNAILE